MSKERGGRRGTRRRHAALSPLFVELFKHADQIAAKYEPTAGGVRVVETSTDASVVKLLQAHAEVVSAFLANGMSEMMKHHPVPPR